MRDRNRDVGQVGRLAAKYFFFPPFKIKVTWPGRLGVSGLVDLRTVSLAGEPVEDDGACGLAMGVARCEIRYPFRQISVQQYLERECSRYFGGLRLMGHGNPGAPNS